MTSHKIYREVLAGISTFLTILYLFILYPQLMNAGGIDLGAAFTATVLITTLATLFMGVYGKSPIALAPGLGAGAFMVYSLAIGQQVPWPTILGFVFWSGFVIFLISVFKLRQSLINNLPPALRIGTIAGIGLFLICVGLKELEIIAPDPDIFWRFIGIGGPSHIVALLSLVLLIILYQRGIAGCYILSILFGWFIGLSWGLFPFGDIVSITPPSLFPISMNVDLSGALQWSMFGNLLALFLINIFDTSATLPMLTHEAQLMDEKGHIRYLNRQVMTDGPGSMLASLFGVGILSFLVESLAGIKAGGRTGFTAIIVSILSLGALFFFPFISSIPMFVTAPVLLMLGFLMATEIRFLKWRDFTDLVPALLSFIVIPLTFSIYIGFALAFISFTILKALRGQSSQVHPICWIITLFFIYYFFAR